MLGNGGAFWVLVPVTVPPVIVPTAVASPCTTVPLSEMLAFVARSPLLPAVAGL